MTAEVITKKTLCLLPSASCLIAIPLRLLCSIHVSVKLETWSSPKGSMSASSALTAYFWDCSWSVMHGPAGRGREQPLTILGPLASGWSHSVLPLLFSNPAGHWQMKKGGEILKRSLVFKPGAQAWWYIIWHPKPQFWVLCRIWLQERLTNLPIQRWLQLHSDRQFALGSLF